MDRTNFRAKGVEADASPVIDESDQSAPRIETVEVLGASVSNQDLAGGSPMAPNELAFTGFNSMTLAQVGFLLAFAGIGLVTLSGRREEALLLEV